MQLAPSVSCSASLTEPTVDAASQHTKTSPVDAMRKDDLAVIQGVALSRQNKRNLHNTSSQTICMIPATLCAKCNKGPRSSNNEQLCRESELLQSLFIV